MLGIKVAKKSAEAVKAYLKAHKLLDKQHYVFSRGAFIYFPILDKGKVPDGRLSLLGGKAVDAKFKRSGEAYGYKELLLKRVGREAFENAVKSFDLIGSTAIIDAPPNIAKVIAKSIMDSNPRIVRVISKSGAVSGVYRTRKFRHVAGESGYEVTYSENNIRISLDIRKAFFSPRLAYERKRVSDCANDGEKVIVMFAGVGPFAVLIGKEHRKSEVVAMELNRHAYNYMKKNISLNKLSNVTPLLGNVNEFASKYKGFAGRIIMPLPKDSKDFLPAADKMASNGCVIHFYAFGAKDDPYKEPSESITEFFTKRGKKVRFLHKRIVRTYSPETVEVVIDFSVSKKRQSG